MIALPKTFHLPRTAAGRPESHSVWHDIGIAVAGVALFLALAVTATSGLPRLQLGSASPGVEVPQDTRGWDDNVDPDDVPLFAMPDDIWR